jgi:hypothetical protein
MASMLSHLAQIESGNLAERVRSTQEHLVKNGRWRGGKPNFGYQVPKEGPRVLIPEPAEAAILNGAADLIIDKGMNLTRTTDTLNKRGHRTRSGGLLRAPNLSKWLRAPATGGAVMWDGAQVRTPDGGLTSCITEPVMPSARWKDVVDVLNANHPTGRGQGRRSGVLLLTHLVICGKCGARMHGTTRQFGAYKCPAAGDGSASCVGTAISRSALDAFVTEYVLQRLTPDAIAQGATARRRQQGLTDKRLAAAQEKTAAVEAALQNIEDDRDAGVYNTTAGKRQFQKRMARRMAELESAERELHQIEAREHRLLQATSRPIDRAEWDGLDLDQKRSIVAMLVEHIKVAKSAKGRGSGPVFDGSRVHIEPAPL